MSHFPSVPHRTITEYDALVFMMGEDQALVAQLPGAKEAQKPVCTLFFCVLQCGSRRDKTENPSLPFAMFPEGTDHYQNENTPTQQNHCFLF